MKKAASKTKSIVFNREFRGQLFEIPAELVGESVPRCAVCHEPEEGHSRNGRRKHAFEPERGYTVVVHYPDQEPETRHHVTQGNGANQWKEK